MCRSRLRLLIPILAIASSGCDTAGYLVHVGAGQLRYLGDRELLDETRVRDLGESERAGLHLLREAQRFGAALGLARTRSYRHVIDRDQDSAVQVVVAAPPDHLEAVTWWFPIVGRVSYRGYFDRERARAFADSLASEGLDTYVRPALLYSTLGFFDDPIPIAVLRWSDPDLVDVVLHELVHETIFVSGDTEYNEALASFIGMQATLAFLGGRSEAMHAEARRVFADRIAFARLLGDLSEDLRTVYASNEGAAAIETRRDVFRRYQGQVYPSLDWETRRYDGFVDLQLSNAYVVAQNTYSALLPCFEREMAALDGNLEAFIAAHVADPGRHGCPTGP